MSTGVALPDLLHRFVATPHRFEIALHSTSVAFETNDQEILSSFRAQTERLLDALGAAKQPWHWKIVRDGHGSQDGSDVLVLIGQRLTTVFIGTGTIVAIDRNRGELLGFVAANIHVEHLLDALLDIATQHLRRDTTPDSNQLF